MTQNNIASANDMTPNINRGIMMVIGALAGAAFWFFAEIYGHYFDSQRLFLFSSAAVMGWFAIMMALSGPLRPIKAAVAALVLALPGAILFLWASYQFDGVRDFMRSGHALAALMILMIVSTPFMAAGLQRPGGWKRYDMLFDISWTIVVRYVASMLFLGLFWLVTLLSNELLELVGVGIIDDLLDIEPVPYVFSGMILGLALSVVHELRAYVSPFLIHRLLRLIMPVMLVVVAVFIVMLPVRGLNDLFGTFSAAATLMAVCLVAITLVTTAVDRTDEDGVETRIMRWSAKGLAVFLPILAGLAVYAVWIRVAQYGWTPERGLAVLAALFLAAYAVFYALSILARDAWMARVRTANRIMALALIAVAVLWQTPIINMEKIATQNQVARFEAGKTTVGQLPLRQMWRKWGHPGKAGIVALEAMKTHDKYAELMVEIDTARNNKARRDMNAKQREEQAKKNREELRDLMEVRPKNVTLPEGAFDSVSRSRTREWLNGCKRLLADGRAGCVMVIGDFDPNIQAPHGIVFFRRTSAVSSEKFTIINNVLSEFSRFGSHVSLGTSGEGIAKILDGDFALEAPVGKALRVGTSPQIPYN